MNFARTGGLAPTAARAGYDAQPGALPGFRPRSPATTSRPLPPRGRGLGPDGSGQEWCELACTSPRRIGTRSAYEDFSVSDLRLRLGPQREGVRRLSGCSPGVGAALGLLARAPIGSGAPDPTDPPHVPAGGSPDTLPGHTVWTGQERPGPRQDGPARRFPGRHPCAHTVFAAAARPGRPMPPSRAVAPGGFSPAEPRSPLIPGVAWASPTRSAAPQLAGCPDSSGRVWARRIPDQQAGVGDLALHLMRVPAYRRRPVHPQRGRHSVPTGRTGPGPIDSPLDRTGAWTTHRGGGSGDARRGRHGRAGAGGRWPAWWIACQA